MGQVCEKDFNNKNTLVPVTFKGWDTDYFDPENIFIKHNERIFRLSELATVKKHEENPRSYYRINGLNTININVRSAPGANQIVIAGLVKKKVEALRQNLPSGYSLNISYDSSVQLKKELNKIVLRIFLSLVILLLFVFIVSRSPRYLLVITISILTNIIIAFILYYLFHIEIHMYSLAGITLSFGIMIDNTIVMIDHLRNGRGTSIFRAILAATLTTMGALLVVFFLDEDMRLRLLDFAWVIIINLAVSLFISLFFIPALLDKIPLRKRRNRRTFKRFRRKVKYTLFYNRTIVFLARFRWAVLLISVLGFGLPAYMLPVQVKGDYWYSKWYNNTIGSKTYLQYIKPVTDVTLGGTLRLFTQKVKHASLTHTDMRTSVNVSATMNDGSTLQQTNVIFEKLENFLAQFDEIELFETRINSPASARIVILFKPEFEFTNFPFSLKSEIESKVIELGSADWFVSGVGRAFDNSLREGNRDSRIVLYGYNLEALKSYAQKVKTYLEEIPRVEQNSIFINGRATQGNNIHREYYLDMDLDKMQRTGISRGSVLYRLSELSKENRVMTMYKNGNAESINLVPDKLNIPDFWEISNKPLKLNNNEITRLAGLGSFYKEREQDLINKENMEYTMVVEFNFIGSFGQKKYIIGEVEKRLAQELKVGYRIKQQYNKGGSWNNDKNDYRQFTLILLVITIIFFICAIVFESLLQPLAVLMMIPMSFIGVFLTFYIFELGFDQGGYAALLLLSGLTVNSALYILNEFNNVRKKFHNITPLRAYLKAFNNKLIPVILTLISTVLGLTPFLSGGKKEAFWFSMASGTIGGLTFSLAAIVIILPLFVKGVKKRKNN
jgi:multidrug efflux pump subunit AcrB